jgi:Fic family protein
MPDWDEDSAELRANLTRVLAHIRDAARRRQRPTVQDARRWHADMMQGLDPDDVAIRDHFRGVFRGEPGLDGYNVRVGPHVAVPAKSVAAELGDFERRLQAEVQRLDAKLPPGAEPDAATLAEILDLCAWAHAEWVRIHPFANGNGRTARMWANSLAMRYNLPPFVRLRPRPDNGYGFAGALAMRGVWRPTAVLFRRLLQEFVRGSDAT